jgi:predicted small lipoprotein YifL
MKSCAIAALLLSATALAACGQNHGTCKAPPTAKVTAEAFSKPPRPIMVGQPGYEVQEAKASSEQARACVQRQAWALSSSKDSTDTVADAAVTACDEPIARAAQAEAAGYGGDARAPYDLDVKAMGRWARLYVVQYRSGQCVE